MDIIAFQDFIRRFYSGEDFILFDTETTGLNTFHDDIIEIGATRWNKNGAQESFEELIWVNPNKITQAAWEVHRIPIEEIEAARKPEEVLEDFVKFAGDRPLVAHNIKFDFPMLNSNLVRSGLRPYQNDQVACSLIYAKEQQLPGKLSALAEYYGVKTEDGALHRALYDVGVLAKVLEALLKEHEPEEMQYSLVL
ncbi:MAG: 3'-5' exonuclease [Candidatus Peregrinibacteria bacterium]|nr:3'-5' exonuclease [Candidatus Peregrinibacteria bacterium]